MLIAVSIFPSLTVYKEFHCGFGGACFDDYCVLNWWSTNFFYEAFCCWAAKKNLHHVPLLQYRGTCTHGTANSPTRDN